MFETDQSWVNSKQTPTSQEVWMLVCVTLNLQETDHLFWNYKMKEQECAHLEGKAWNSKLPQALGIYDSFPFKMCRCAFRKRQEVHPSLTHSADRLEPHLMTGTWPGLTGRNGEGRCREGGTWDSILFASGVGPYATQAFAPTHTWSAAS